MFNIFFPNRCPFDWKTIIGYLACICIQIPTVFLTGQLYILTLLLILGFCYFLTDFVLDIEEHLQQLNETIIEKNNAKYYKFQKKFIDFIQFHTESLQLSNGLNISNLKKKKHQIFFFFFNICTFFLNKGLCLNSTTQSATIHFLT